MVVSLRTCLVAAACAWVACDPSTEAPRAKTERGSLGHELYGVLCDRVGAQSLREDVTGASYQRLCHPPAKTSAPSSVDRERLPPLTEGARNGAGEVVPLRQQRGDREHGIARVEVLAEERDALAAAFDAMLPDVTLPRADCQGAKAEVPLHTALREALSELVPLYDDETVPRVSRALGALLGEVATDTAVQRSLSRLDARKGYQPQELSLYVLGPVLSYPRLFELGDALSTVQREDRHGAKQALSGLLRQVGRELAEIGEDNGATEPPLVLTPDSLMGRNLPSRPRTLRELALSLLTAPAVDGVLSPIFIVRRDARGLAQVLPREGVLPWPFIADSAGRSMIDNLGRFVTRDGRPAPEPFASAEVSGVPRDALERALSSDGLPLYGTLDIPSSLLHGLAAPLAPLFRPREDRGQEALLEARALEGPWLGPRLKQPDGTSRFSATSAPILDLVHAFGSVLARPEFDDTLALLTHVAREHPDTVARAVRLGLSLDAVAKSYPDVSLRAESTLWDELLEVFATMANQGTLLEDVLAALTDERTARFGAVLASHLRYRDEITYYRDRHDIESRASLNGKPWNATTGDFGAMRTPVDRTQPDSGANRSVLQRLLQVLRDVNGLTVCSKEGAVAHVDITWPPGRLGIPVRLDYPTNPAVKAVCAFLGSRAPSRIPECGILRFDDIAQMLIEVAVGDTNIVIRDDCLNRLVHSPISRLVGGANKFLEDVSGIDGLSLAPTPQGVGRLALFDAPYSQWGGYAGDIYYPKTSRFLKDAMDPVPTMVCPVQAYTDPSDGKVLQMHRCERFADTLRGRDPNSMFALEQLDFIPLVQPIARAFAKNHANGSFVSLLDVLHRHWGSPRQTRVECDPALPPTHARHCTQDGVSAYEPMLATMLDEGGLLTEVGELVRVVAASHVRHCDAYDADGRCTQTSERDGLHVLSEAARGLTDPGRNQGLTDRRGELRQRRNDGSLAPQTTPLGLALSALARADAAWASQPAQYATWRRARSAIVDSLFAVTGTDAAPRFALGALDVALPLLLDLTREQVAAQCPPQAGSGRCDWATRGLSASAGEWLQAPVTASLLETADAVLADRQARTELGRFLAYALEQTDDSKAQTAITAALLDLLQVLDDDSTLRPLSQLASHALASDSDDKTALAPAALEFLARVFDRPEATGCAAVDPTHAFAFALDRMVQPMGAGRRAPIQVFLDVLYRVNRADPRARASLAPEDFAALGKELSQVMLDDAGGLEQVYSLLHQATGRAP